MQCFTLTGKILAVTGTYAYTALDRLISAPPLSILGVSICLLIPRMRITLLAKWRGLFGI